MTGGDIGAVAGETVGGKRVKERLRKSRPGTPGKDGAKGLVVVSRGGERALVDTFEGA